MFEWARSVAVCFDSKLYKTSRRHSVQTGTSSEILVQVPLIPQMLPPAEPGRFRRAVQPNLNHKVELEPELLEHRASAASGRKI
jgi:hypothetical protein